MQQINLYQEEFRTPKDPLSAVLIGQVVAGSLAVIIVVAAVAGLIGWGAAAEVREIKGEAADLTEQSRLLAGELRARDQGASFAKSVQLAERKLASSETIRVFLGQLQRKRQRRVFNHYERPRAYHPDWSEAHYNRARLGRRKYWLSRRSNDIGSCA